MQKQLIKWIIGSFALSAMTLTGCTPKHPVDPNDPLQEYNRAMFAFNKQVDRFAIRPVAVVYNAITPSPVQKGVTNFFKNTFEITTFPNDFLQGNFTYLLVDFWRFAINTTVGIGGLFDVATKMGIKPHVETFGLTLAKWRQGKSAPYFVVPILGPSTLQNAPALAVDAFLTPWPYFKSNCLTYIPPAVGLISIRAEMLPADKLINNSFDPYVFIRDAYMQRESQRIAENDALGKK